MARLPRAWWWRCSLAAAACLASPARASSIDPRTLRNQLEDQVLDGDRDAEDLLALQLLPRAVPLHRTGPAYIAIDVFADQRPSGVLELGAMVVLQLPLDGFCQAPLPSAFPAERRAAIPFSAPFSAPADETPFRPAKHPGARPAGIFQQAAARVERPAPPAPVVTTDVARACVRAALRTVGLADDSRLDSIGARARSSAALPELRLRAARTSDQSGRVTLSDADLYRYIEAGGATNVLEARLTFRLDRLLFADDEIAIERIRVDRSELRARTSAKVLQALFEWQRAYALQQDPGLSSDEHFSAMLRELEAGAILDVMTDGWFGRFRASLEGRSR